MVRFRRTPFPFLMLKGFSDLLYKFTEPKYGICPRCGKGKLVSRNGKYGKFLGCNRYPRCKYTQDY